MIFKHQALELSRVSVESYMTEGISSMLGRPIKCVYQADDADYWTVKMVDQKLPLDDLFKLFKAVNADEKIRRRSLPREKEEYVRDLDMDLANLILSTVLQLHWKWQYAGEEGLWLIGVDYDVSAIKICSKVYDLQKLKTKQELLDHLTENGATHASLMDFCEDYLNQYHNDLCWPYPISDGLHLGTFFVLVKEGIACLPYNEATKEGYEHFCLDDVTMLDGPSLELLIDDWHTFSGDLWQAMHDMLWYLKKQEAVHEEKP